MMTIISHILSIETKVVNIHSTSLMLNKIHAINTAPVTPHFY